MKNEHNKQLLTITSQRDVYPEKFLHRFSPWQIPIRCRTITQLMPLKDHKGDAVRISGAT